MRKGRIGYRMRYAICTLNVEAGGVSARPVYAGSATGRRLFETNKNFLGREVVELVKQNCVLVTGRSRPPQS